MGTSGSGPFDSDTALDTLATLGPMMPSERLDLVARTLDAAIESASSSSPDILPEEVIASAAVIAANSPGGEELPWNSDVPGILEWLPKPVPSSLARSALRALDATIPAGGWWWQSWTDDADRDQIANALEEIRAILRNLEEE
jgi:hypothetical protein